jgi:hypothetical protein
MVVAVQLCAVQGGAVQAQAYVEAVGQPLTHTLSWQRPWQAVLPHRVLSLHSVAFNTDTTQSEVHCIRKRACSIIRCSQYFSSVFQHYRTKSAATEIRAKSSMCAACATNDHTTNADV